VRIAATGPFASMSATSLPNAELKVVSAASARTPSLEAAREVAQAASARTSWLNAALVKVAAASAVLVPAAIAARFAGVARRTLLEYDRAAMALAQLGITERPLSVEPLGGGRSNAVYKLRFADRTLVLKQGLAEGTVLAFGARWVGPQPFANDVTAVARIGREARALELLHAAGVRVPRVIAANPAAALLLVEYVEGTPLPATLHRAGSRARIRAYGKAIRAAHAAGITLGDGHPGNALVAADGAITLFDLEFAQPAGEVDDFAAHCAFDFAYASFYFTDDERAVFLEVAGLEHAFGIRAATAKLADFAVLFEREIRRQRVSAATTAVLATPMRRAA
jgi:tRNA A-37 threonylcarbamoyl transferase component Bud32